MSDRSRDPRVPRWAWPAGYVTLFTAVSLLLLPAFRHHVSPDGLCYIDIARKLAAGDVHHAINAYWGPLLSWLMVPLLVLGVEPLLAGKLAGLLSGIAACVALYRYSGRFALTPLLRAAALLAALPLLWFAALTSVGPDLLLVAALLQVFAATFRDDALQRVGAGIGVGVLGGLAYLAKAYGFYFFVAFLVMIVALQLWREPDAGRRRAVLRGAGLALVTFAAIAGAWIAVLSTHQGELTVGTSGTYNHAIYGPEMRGHPMHYAGFLPPPDETALSAWDDPARLDVADWSALDSPATRRHQLRLFAANLLAAARYLQDGQVLAIPILLAHLLLLVRPWRRSLRDGRTAYPLATALLFVLPYCTLIVVPRYLWLVMLMLPLMGAHLLSLADARSWLSPARRWCAAALLALCVAAAPTADLIESGLQDRGGRRIHELAGYLEQRYPIEGPIASNRDWHRTLALAWHLGVAYYGEPGEMPPESIVPRLRELGVSSYFVWYGTPAERALLSGYPELTGADLPGLEIYDLRHAVP